MLGTQVTRVEIKRIGNYLETDEQGFLQSRADPANVTDPWRAAVEAVTSAYLENWPTSIHSIYVRGSIAKGLAVAGTSDVDSFALLKPGCEQEFSYEAVKAWAETVEQNVKEKFPFVTGVEVGLETFEEAQDRENPYALILKIEAACVYGEHLADEIAPYKPGPEMAFQTKYFRSHLETFLAEYPAEPEAEQPDFINWMMRRFLRLGMELVMVEEQRFTRDLYLCYESFAKHYPAKAAKMYRALELAINPVLVRKPKRSSESSVSGWPRKPSVNWQRGVVFRTRPGFGCKLLERARQKDVPYQSLIKMFLQDRLVQELLDP